MAKFCGRRLSIALISFFTSVGEAIRNQISPGIGSASIKVRLAETTEEEEEEFNLGGQKKRNPIESRIRNKIAVFELKVP